MRNRETLVRNPKAMVAVDLHSIEDAIGAARGTLWPLLDAGAISDEALRAALYGDAGPIRAAIETAREAAGQQQA